MSNLARTRGVVTELKIPALGPFVVVAKRAASGIGACAGFSLDDIDDLNIAVAQACEKAISAGERIWGQGGSELKLTFRIVESGIEVEVKNLPTREAVEAVARRQQAGRLAAARQRQARASQELDLEELAVNMIRLFVDDLRYRVDSSGSMRMRMVKYLVE